MTDIISNFSGEYRFLSNFAPLPVTYEGVTYPTAEHAFAAAKTLDKAAREQIRKAKTARDAKVWGRGVELRPEWDDVIRYEAMYQIVRSKFEGEAKHLLLATNNAKLVEGNTWHDQFWGNCSCPTHIKKPGKNLLGMTLMLVRDELRKETE